MRNAKDKFDEVCQTDDAASLSWLSPLGTSRIPPAITTELRLISEVGRKGHPAPYMPGQHPDAEAVGP